MYAKRASHQKQNQKKKKKGPKSMLHADRQIADSTALKLGGRANDELIEMFDLLDTNGSGSIDKGEQKSAKKQLHSMMLPQARFDWLDIDTNNDGKVTLEECLNA